MKEQEFTALHLNSLKLRLSMKMDHNDNHTEDITNDGTVEMKKCLGPSASAYHPMNYQYQKALCF